MDPVSQQHFKNPPLQNFGCRVPDRVSSRVCLEVEES